MAPARSSRVVWVIPLILIVGLFCCPFACGKVIQVDDDGQADFDNIQAGIDVAEIGDTVLVMPGEYVITEPITFRGKVITVKSEAGRDQTTIRMGTPADPKRGSVVVFESNETADSVLDGFTITGGRGSWDSSANNWGGGGIAFGATSGTVKDCAIVQNSTRNGGGVMVYSGASTVLINCVIGGNSATGVTFGVDGYGGGLFCGPGCLLTLTKCTIMGNSAVRGGGGLHCWQNLSLIMTDCAIVGNTVQYAGGGMTCDSGSAILTNCVIARNTGAKWGGGLCSAFADSSVTISNCTIWGNSATEAGGVGCYDGGSATITNSILWGNTATTANEVYLEQAPTEFSVAYSDVAGGRDGVSVEGGCTLNWGEGNIDADPLFAKVGYWADINDLSIVVEPDDPNAVWIDGDFHLKSEVGRWDPKSESWVLDDVTSPCIDRGDPNSPIGDEPDPNGGIINMGAYGGTPEASMSIGTLVPLPAPIPIAYWKLDEAEGDIAHDSTGIHDGTVIGVPVWRPDGGQVGGALELSGSANLVMTPFVRDPSQGPLSIMAWIKGGAPGQVVLSQAGGVNWLMANPASGVLMTELKDAERLRKNLSSQVVITDGNWHRVGLVCDGSSRKLYVDDVVVAEDPEGPLAGTMAGLHIGAASTPAVGSFWAGLIDDVKIYDRAVKP